MLNKLVDVLKEVFWLKKPGSKKRAAKKTPKKTAKKAVKKKTAAPKPASKKVVAKSVAKALVKPDPKVIKAQKEALKAPKKPAKPVGPVIDPNLVQMGEITHYFDRIKVCVLKINHGTVLIGDKLTVVGPKTKFVQKIWSMQIESEDVKVAKKGELIGIKIDKPVEPGFIVYK
jgi:hypothetical protein